MEQRRLFAVPGFPGNLAVFIPGNSGMKKSGNENTSPNPSLLWLWHWWL